MKLAMLPLLVVALASPGNAEGVRADTAAGTYVLRFSEEALASFRLAGTPVPTVRLRLGGDFTFEVQRIIGARSTAASGHYKLERDKLVLQFETDSPLGEDRVEGEFDDQGLNLHGFSYVRERERRQAPDRAEDFGGERVTRPAAAPSIDLPGTWTVRRNGYEDKGMRVVFGKDGTFAFKMSNASSRGKYVLEDGHLVLLWTEVDGEAVELGSMRKRVPLSDDGSFKIDTYRYEKAA